MFRSPVYLLCTLGVALSGCEKKEEPVEQKQARPAAVKAEPSSQAEPAGPGQEIQQCRRILDKCWQAIQPTLGKLGVEDPASVEPEYRKSAADFLTRCQRLPKEGRDCLEAADNPVAGIQTCKVNQGRKPEEKLSAPDLRKHIGLFRPQPLSAEAKRRLLTRVRGRWVNEWKEAKTKTSWRIDKRGRVKEQKKTPRGKVEKRQFRIEFLESDRMQVHWSKSSSQSFVFVQTDKRTFYASGNPLYGAYPFKNQESFAVRNNWDIVLYEAGRCQAVTGEGIVVEADCAFAVDEGKRLFRVRYQIPGRLMLNKAPRADERTYHVLGDRLLRDSLVRSGKFVKQ